MNTLIPFKKYQCTGNDFVLIDNRKSNLRFSRSEIAKICHRRFGVGADGLILLNSIPDYDFEMRNFNSDGGECSMCGNGGRALIRFAHELGIKKEQYRFMAIDGIHEGRNFENRVELKMKSVMKITETSVGPTLDTGSPHLVIEVKNLLNFEVVKEGRLLRNSPLFMPSGVNTNFFEESSGHIFLRTYERGVEDETLSCGTGAIATAIVVHQRKNQNSLETVETPIHCQGGELLIRFTPTSEQHFEDIWLTGPVEKTFEGEL